MLSSSTQLPSPPPRGGRVRQYRRDLIATDFANELRTRRCTRALDQIREGKGGGPRTLSDDGSPFVAINL